jgi:hypothetical protein
MNGTFSLVCFFGLKRQMADNWISVDTQAFINDYWVKIQEIMRIFVEIGSKAAANMTSALFYLRKAVKSRKRGTSADSPLKLSTLAVTGHIFARLSPNHFQRLYVLLRFTIHFGRPHPSSTQ